MKRRGAPLGEPRPQLKKMAGCPCEEGELPYKLQMLQHWQITPEAARFLEISDRIAGTRVSDTTCPQLCLMIYSPNPHQSLLDALPPAHQPSLHSPMDVQVSLTEG